MSVRKLSLAAVLLSLAGCPSSDDTNPATLWLAPLNGETMVQLIDHAPPVY